MPKRSHRRADPGQVIAGRDDDAGRHHDRLGDDRRDRLRPFQLDHLLDELRVGLADRLGGAGERRAIGVGGVEVQEAARERLVGGPPARPAAGGERVPGRAVVGAVVGEHLVPGGGAGLLVVLARHLDRGLGDLRSAREELHRRVLAGQDVEQRPHQLERPVVGGQRRAGEGEPLVLACRRLGQRLVAVAEVDAEGAGQPVDVAPAVHVGDPDPAPLGQDERVLGEVLHRQEVHHDPARQVFHRSSSRIGLKARQA